MTLWRRRRHEALKNSGALKLALLATKRYTPRRLDEKYNEEWNSKNRDYVTEKITNLLVSMALRWKLFRGDVNGKIREMDRCNSFNIYSIKFTQYLQECYSDTSDKY